MAQFEVRVHRVRIEEHPDADALEIARIGGYRSVVRKEQFQDGDLAAYIPESSIVPDGAAGADGADRKARREGTQPGQGRPGYGG